MSTLSNEFHFIEVWWNLSYHLIEFHFFFSPKLSLSVTILKFNILDFHFANVQCPPYLIGLYWGLSSTLLRAGGAYLAALLNFTFCLDWARPFWNLSLGFCQCPVSTLFNWTLLRVPLYWGLVELIWPLPNSSIMHYMGAAPLCKVSVKNQKKRIKSRIS